MPIVNSGISLINALLNFVYPPFCAYCNVQLQGDERLFCTKCWQFAEPAESGSPKDLTAAKVWDSLPLQNVKSLWLFNDFVQAVIHEMKYKRKLSLTKRLGAEVASALLQDKEFSDTDLLIPVPLHKSKQRERGYNQSLLIAKSIARNTGIAVGNKIIRRIQKTQTQAKLNAEQRMKNVKEAFYIQDAEKIRDKNIILIDDVCTTGATLFACGDVLLQAGCSRVLAVTVAKAPDVEQDFAF